MVEIEMNSKEMAESAEYHRRNLFEVGGKAKPIEYAYPVKVLRVRESSDPLLTFVD